MAYVCVCVCVLLCVFLYLTGVQSQTDTSHASGFSGLSCKSEQHQRKKKGKRMMRGRMLKIMSTCWFPSETTIIHVEPNYSWFLW